MTMGVEELETLWNLYNNDALKIPDYHLDLIILDLSNITIHPFPFDVDDLVQASCNKLIINLLLNDDLPSYDIVECIIDHMEDEYKISMVVDYHKVIRYLESIEPLIKKSISKYVNLDEVVMLARGDVIELENKDRCIWLSDIQSVQNGDRCMLNCIFKIYTKRGTI